MNKFRGGRLGHIFMLSTVTLMQVIAFTSPWKHLFIAYFYSLLLTFIHWRLSPATSSVFWCWSCFVCSWLIWNIQWRWPLFHLHPLPLSTPTIYPRAFTPFTSILHPVHPTIHHVYLHPRSFHLHPPPFSRPHFTPYTTILHLVPLAAPSSILSTSSLQSIPSIPPTLFTSILHPFYLHPFTLFTSTPLPCSPESSTPFTSTFHPFCSIRHQFTSSLQYIPSTSPTLITSNLHPFHFYPVHLQSPTYLPPPLHLPCPPHTCGITQ